jgi:acetyl-CoA synthetase
MNETLLTVEQAAERLQVGTFTVREQLRDGRLRGIKRGRLWRVPESALMESSSETPRKPDSQRQADQIWRALTSGDGDRHNAAIVALSKTPQDVRDVVLKRSAQALASYYASDEGREELADWRAIDGDPFADDNEEDAI